jgi:hypothetical protein
MKKNVARVLAVLAIVTLGLVLPACESYEGGGTSTVYVGVGYGVYGGYYGPGWGGCCYGPPGGVVVRPPVGGYGGPRPMPY